LDEDCVAWAPITSIFANGHVRGGSQNSARGRY
jgi:hypothetical protein